MQKHDIATLEQLREVIPEAKPIVYRKVSQAQAYHALIEKGKPLRAPLDFDARFGQAAR